MRTERSDVVVIGGGPAGSTVAAHLSMRGHRVTVLERARMPRDHVGESLLPFCYHLFEELGVLDEMKRRYVRKPGVRFLDADGTTQTTYCFGVKVEGPSYLSFHVLRSEFDLLLLENAERLGAEVHQETRAERVDFGSGPDDPVVVEAVDAGGERHRFVIDASGRDTFLANRQKTKIAHKELERTALGSHWRGMDYQAGMGDGLLQILYTGGEKKGWIWVIPLGRDRVSCGAVMNTSYFREQRAKLKAEGVEDWMQALYRQEIMASAFIRDITRNAEQFWPVVHNGDYSYFVTEKWGDRFALVGDASAFIDPIFSSGVYLAMNSAKLLAGAVHEWLDTGRKAGDEALEEVYGTIVGAYELVDKLIRHFYDPGAINWAQLGAASDLLHEEKEKAMALQHHLLAGDFFESHARYSSFVDELTDPVLLRRYKRYVLERKEFQTPECPPTHEPVFHPELAEHEARREALGI
jgi:hypothetical protein